MQGSLARGLCLNCLAAVLQLASVTGAQAEAARFVPAHWSSETAAALAELPDGLEGAEPLAVRCTAYARFTGKVRATLCFENEAQPRRSRLVGEHVRRVLMRRGLEPARIDGQAVRSTLSLSVVLFEADGAQRVRLVPNHGLDVEALGTPDYVAPQRYVFPNITCVGLRRDQRVMALVRVSAQGEPLSVEITGEGLDSVCLRHLEMRFGGASFVPAVLEGRPVEAHHLELFH